MLPVNSIAAALATSHDIPQNLHNEENAARFFLESYHPQGYKPDTLSPNSQFAQSGAAASHILSNWKQSKYNHPAGKTDLSLAIKIAIQSHGKSPPDTIYGNYSRGYISKLCAPFVHYQRLQHFFIDTLLKLQICHNLSPILILIYTSYYMSRHTTDHNIGFNILDHDGIGTNNHIIPNGNFT